MKKFFISILIILVLVSGLARASSTGFLTWGMTPVMTQIDANPYVVSSCSFFTTDGKPFVAWSSQMGQFLALPNNLGAEFRVVPNGLDPEKITRIGLTFDDGQTWHKAEKTKGIGWLVKVPLDELPQGRVITPQWGIEGYFRQNKLQVFIFVFRWNSLQSVYGAFQFIIKETPDFFKQLASDPQKGRYNMFVYGRAVEGAMPTWIQEPITKYEEESSLTIQFFGNGSFFLREDDSVSKITISGKEMVWEVEGKKKSFTLSEPGKIVWSNGVQIGSKYQVKPDGGEWSEFITVKEGHHLQFILKKITKMDAGLASKYLKPVFEWKVLSGDPRYQEFQKYLGLIDSEEKAKTYFLSSFAVKDMSALGLAESEICEIRKCVQENGIESREYQNGQVINSNLTFGRLLRVARGPFRMNWANASRAIGYYPKGYDGKKVPVIIGRAFRYDGTEFPGCVNMFLETFGKTEWVVQGYQYEGKKKLVTLQPPNSPVGYVTPERPQYTVTQAAIASFQLIRIPEMDIDIKMPDINIDNNIDVNVLNEIFNSINNDININNEITNNITNNIINQILNIINNANANNNG